MSLKSAAQSLFSTILVLYIYSTCGAGLYFNYEYARDNGFMSWLTLGQIIPTVEGAIWPYFAIRHHLHGQEEAREYARLDHSARADSVRRVLTLVSSVQSMFEKSPSSRTDSLRRARLLRASISDIESVAPNTLNEVYPGWGDVMHDAWLPAARTMARIIHPDTLPTIPDVRSVAGEAVAQVALYDQWTSANMGALLKTLFEKHIVEAYTDSVGTVHE